MSSERWSFQDAKSRFGAIVEAARRGRPQIVTRHGIPTAVVLSIEDYERFAPHREPAPTSFTDLLLSLPQDDGDFQPFDSGLRDWE
jgi:prevent-host-death family protein